MFESMLLRWEIRDKRTEKREILGNYPLKYGDVELKRRAEKLNFERKNAPYFLKPLISYLGRENVRAETLTMWACLRNRLSTQHC